MKVSDSIKDYLKGTDTAQVISEWWSSMDEYWDEWSSLLTKQTSKDSDNKITESQVNAENHNNEVTKWEDTNSKLLAKINDNVKISNSNSLLSDSNPTSELKIESSVSGVWMISVEFIWTGDSCIKIDGNSLCNGKTYQKNFDPKETPYLGEVSLASHVAWKIWLIIRMGIWWSSYIERVIKYTVSPGVLHKVDVKFWNKVAVAWILSPITIVWYDEYWNEVEWWLDDKYEFTVSQWKFWKDGSYKESFTTNDFRNLSFSYQAPLDAVDWTATVQVQSVLGGKVIWTWKISIVQASPVIKINWNTVLTGKDNLSVNQSYKLLSDEGVYTWWNLIVSKLQKIEINIANSNWKLVDFNWQVSVSSNNWLFTIWKVTKKSDWKYSFNKSSNFDLSWGKAIIYFYPKTIAWNDTISINIPGLASRTINYTVYPADWKKVQLKMENDYVELWWKAKFEVYVSDVWWNPTNGELTLISDSNYVEFPDLKQTRRDADMIYNNISVKNGYLKTTI